MLFGCSPGVAQVIIEAGRSSFLPHTPYIDWLDGTLGRSKEVKVKERRERSEGNRRVRGKE